jgi:hypothetical protein
VAGISGPPSPKVGFDSPGTERVQYLVWNHPQTGTGCGYRDATSVGKEVISMARKIGRDARDGRFIPVKVAQDRKGTAVVETIKTPKK